MPADEQSPAWPSEALLAALVPLLFSPQLSHPHPHPRHRQRRIRPGVVPGVVRSGPDRDGGGSGWPLLLIAGTVPAT